MFWVFPVFVCCCLTYCFGFLMLVVVLCCRLFVWVCLYWYLSCDLALVVYYGLIVDLCYYLFVSFVMFVCCYLLFCDFVDLRYVGWALRSWLYWFLCWVFVCCDVCLLGLVDLLLFGDVLYLLFFLGLLLFRVGFVWLFVFTCVVLCFLGDCLFCWLIWLCVIVYYGTLVIIVDV